MLTMDVIKPAETEWVPPIVFAPKKCRTLQFRMHYCKLIPVTIRDSYLVSNIDECLDSHGNATILSTLDANSDFPKCKSPMKIATNPLSHLIMDSSHYSNAIRPKNAPGRFQRVMDLILSWVK